MVAEKKTENIRKNSNRYERVSNLNLSFHFNVSWIRSLSKLYDLINLLISKKLN